MAQITDLKKGDRVIYYGYENSRHRGDFCTVDTVDITANEVAVIFDSDNTSTSCTPIMLKKVIEKREKTA